MSFSGKMPFSAVGISGSQHLIAQVPHLVSDATIPYSSDKFASLKRVMM